MSPSPVPDLRPAAVAGRFYPSDPAELRSLLDQFRPHPAPPVREAIGAIVPHAGLVYSGACAALVFARLAPPEVAVILAPNHTGAGDPHGRASLWAAGGFASPLGPVPVDDAFAGALLERTDLVVDERRAHRAEHAIEVELPFLREEWPDTTLVPIVIPWVDWEACHHLGVALAHVARADGRSVTIVASSDMTHYEPAVEARHKDEQAIECVLHLDGEGLLRTCRTLGVSMCGRGPAATMLAAAITLEATRAELVDYRHSGMVTGDDASVVAYAGMIVE